MEKQFVQCEIAGGIAIVTIDNPSSLNALNTATLTQLEKTFEEMATNEDVKGVIITGGGEKSFVAGADISEFIQIKGDAVASFMTRGQQIFNRIESFAKPVIAAVNGFALGGGNELAMCCDIRVAAENAVFGQPEVNLGIIPGYGGTQRLSRLVGPGKAKAIILADERINAQEAWRLGLVEKVVPKGQAVVEAKKILEKIMSKGPLAIKMAKKAINEGLKMSLDEGLSLEIQCQTICFQSEDKREGTIAFLEKRPAKFIGR
jgi:enoyl-CoA hydratase